MTRLWRTGRWGLLATVLATAMIGIGWSGTGAQAEGARQPVRVLFVLGSPPVHDIVKLPPILEGVLSQVGGFAVTRRMLAMFTRGPAR